MPIEPFCAEVPVQRPDTVLLSCGTSPLGRAQSFLLEEKSTGLFWVYLLTHFGVALTDAFLC